MSGHYSKYDLNTFLDTPYFQAATPPVFPTRLVMQAARAFRWLPANLRQLATMSRRWAERHGAVWDGHDKWYDPLGRELDPSTGVPLTDAEIDAQWGGGPDPDLASFVGRDIPIPEGGFPDPDTWEERPPEPADDEGDRLPDKQQMLLDVVSHGRQRAEEEYGDRLPPVETEDGLDRDVAKARFARRAAAVLDSPYFYRASPGMSDDQLIQLAKGQIEEKTLLAEALREADTRSDLGGRAEDIFDRAEAYQAYLDIRGSETEDS